MSTTRTRSRALVRRGATIRGGIGARTSRLVLYLMLFLMAVICIFPFYMMITGSFKDNRELVTMKQTLFPAQLDFRKYQLLFSRHPFSRIFLNTAIYASAKVIAGVFFCTLAGFAFAKYPFPGRNALFVVLLGTMMIPFQSIIVPSYLLIRKFGWLNSFYGLIIPGLVPAFGTFLMRQYFIGAVPDEMLEAARIDGASEFRLFWMVGLPMGVSGAAVLGFLLFMNNWNAFLWPLVIVNRQNMFLLTVKIQSMTFNPAYQPDYGEIFAATTIASLPILLMFLVAQRRFISGLMTGFSKG